MVTDEALVHAVADDCRDAGARTPPGASVERTLVREHRARIQQRLTEVGGLAGVQFSVGVHLGHAHAYAQPLQP